GNGAARDHQRRCRRHHRLRALLARIHARRPGRKPGRQPHRGHMRQCCGPDSAGRRLRSGFPDRNAVLLSVRRGSGCPGRDPDRTAFGQGGPAGHRRHCPRRRSAAPQRRVSKIGLSMLKLIELSGTPFEIGQTLGQFGAEAAHSYLIDSPSWHSVMAWRGSAAAKSMADLTEQTFPEIWQELQGLADGLQLPPDDVVLWNCRGDLWSMSPDGCTTVQLPLPDGPRITHNEDGDPGFAGHCGVGLFAPDKKVRFASFVYPASIPGHTFAVTQAGLAMTVNNLRSRRVAIGLPRMVLTRA